MMRLRLSNAGDTESGEAHDVRNVGEALAIATEGG